MTELALAPILRVAQEAERVRQAEVARMPPLTTLARQYALRLGALRATIQEIERLVGRARLLERPQNIDEARVVYQDNRRVAYVDEWRAGNIVAFQRQLGYLQQEVRAVEEELGKAKIVSQDGTTQSLGIRPLVNQGRGRLGTTLTIREARNGP